MHLAHSNICHGQAFRYGKKDYGLQFHLEVNQAMIDRFLRVPENRAEVEIFGGKQAIAQVEEETAAYLARSVELNRRTFHEFVRLFGLGERTKTRA